MTDIRAIAHNIKHLQAAIDKLGLGRPSITKFIKPKPNDFIGLYDVLINNKILISATKKLFVDGHYARAVEEAYKCLNNFVKSKSGLDIDGQDLMNQAFSINNPVLKLNKLQTKSEKDEQLGYMLALGGCMTGIRNPRAHEHLFRDAPDIALEMLTWANHLMRVIDNSKRAKKRKKASNKQD